MATYNPCTMGNGKFGWTADGDDTIRNVAGVDGCIKLLCGSGGLVHPYSDVPCIQFACGKWACEDLRGYGVLGFYTTATFSWTCDYGTFGISGNIAETISGTTHGTNITVCEQKSFALSEQFELGSFECEDTDDGFSVGLYVRDLLYRQLSDTPWIISNGDTCTPCCMIPYYQVFNGPVSVGGYLGGTVLSSGAEAGQNFADDPLTVVLSGHGVNPMDDFVVRDCIDSTWLYPIQGSRCSGCVDSKDPANDKAVTEATLQLSGFIEEPWA